MRYELRYTKRAREDIDRLDSVAKKRLEKKLAMLRDEPFKLSKKLHDSSLGTYRYRLGDYRVVFDIDGHDIVILRVGHRREIYR